MWPLLKTFFHELFFDEAAARRQFRSTMVTFAVSGIAFADQLAALVGLPSAVRVIKVLSCVCGFVGAATSVGEKNTKKESP